MSRNDDIINVAAHRLSTGSIEQVVVDHPGVAEACVVGLPDEQKGMRAMHRFANKQDMCPLPLSHTRLKILLRHSKRSMNMYATR